jgi:hypothetical protein
MFEGVGDADGVKFGVIDGDGETNTIGLGGIFT